jgi:hypothetical protein
MSTATANAQPVPLNVSTIETARECARRTRPTGAPSCIGCPRSGWCSGLMRSFFVTHYHTPNGKEI